MVGAGGKDMCYVTLPLTILFLHFSMNTGAINSEVWSLSTTSCFIHGGKAVTDEATLLTLSPGSLHMCRPNKTCGGGLGMRLGTS